MHQGPTGVTIREVSHQVLHGHMAVVGQHPFHFNGVTVHGDLLLCLDNVKVRDVTKVRITLRKVMVGCKNLTKLEKQQGTLMNSSHLN